MNRLNLTPDDRSLGILICGHGSRNGLAVKEFANLAKLIKSSLSQYPTEYGYLEFAKPTLKEGLEKLREKSVERIVALPAMLFAAGHVKNDIPSILKNFSEQTGIKIDYGRELGINNSMISAAGARIQEAIESCPGVPAHQTLLVVVGRGSSDPDANSNVSKITRILVESFGFGWGDTVFSGVTFPLVEAGLRNLVKLGFRRIIVLPYFLFSGVLVSRIRENTKRVALDNPAVEFINANYLGDHPYIVSTFLERFDEVISGENAMNCSLCKYRSNLLGFENEVGLAQHSHHHHVEGLLEGCQLCTSECTSKCEVQKEETLDIEHNHTHHPYPNADHPLGPLSLRVLKPEES